MKIIIASDHAGFELKQKLASFITELGHEVDDLGTHTKKSVDYPDFARALGQALTAGRGERGVLICGSGVGASIAANKVPGVRAAICHDHYSARQGVAHDDMNVLTLGARVIGIETAKNLVHAFLAAEFSGAERHVRRLNKVKEIEQDFMRISKQG